VQSGETFTSIAVKHYGGIRHLKLITDANPQIDPRRLQVGAKVKIPALPAGALAAASRNRAEGAADTSSPRITSGRSHTVTAGDTWFTLGQRYLGSSARGIELYEFNKGRVPRDLNHLPVGTVIELPPEALAQR
jgi:nucleoid-associated protein YgaU